MLRRFSLRNDARAFTLAEVLITLGVIGVVAAMTIPPLVANYQKHVYVTQLKKAYTSVTQALKLMALDNSCPDDLKCTGMFGSTVSTQDFGDVFVKYFNVVKNCGMDVGSDCISNQANAYYDGIGNTLASTGGSSFYKFITADGTSFSLYSRSDDCVTNWSNTRTGDLRQMCGYLNVDVNGLKKPNIFGRDIFRFYISNGKGARLYPCGGADSTNSAAFRSWQTPAGVIQACYPDYKDGSYCAARIMEEGWQMNY